MEKESKKLVTNNLDLKDFTFLYDTVLIKSLRNDTVDGLVNPEQYDDKPEFGQVMAFGS